MAFENINWGMPVAAQQQQQQQFMNMLGQIADRRQRAEEMDIRRRQLEMKANEEKAFNLKKTAETALVKKIQGMPLTPEEEASIKAMSQVAAPMMVSDGLGGVRAVPSGWGSLASEAPAQPRPMDAMMGNTPRAPQEAPTFFEGQTMQEAAPMGDIPLPRADMPPIPSYKVQNPMMAGTPEGVKAEESYRKDIAQKQAAKAIEERANIEKTTREAKRPLFEPKEGYTPSAEDVKSMTKISQSYKVLDKLLNDYEKKVNKYGVEAAGTAGAKDLARTEGQIRMQVKNLEELGALQEPDVKAMQAMLGSAIFDIGDVINPISGYTQITEGKSVAKKGINDFRDYMGSVLDSAAETRGFNLNIEKKQKPKEQPKQESQAIDYREYFK